jgi:hypothetical protein
LEQAQVIKRLLPVDRAISDYANAGQK